MIGFRKNNKEEFQTKMTSEYELWEIEQNIKAKKKKFKNENFTPTKFFVQFSKITIVALFAFTFWLDYFFFTHVIMQSGQLAITDTAITAGEVVLVAWNAGTILYGVSFLFKSLAETHLEAQDSQVANTVSAMTNTVETKANKIVSTAKEVLEKVNEAVNN